jgi:hypothetical protein
MEKSTVLMKSLPNIYHTKVYKEYFAMDGNQNYNFSGDRNRITLLDVNPTIIQSWP